ncbi:MAG: PucR family transcriptional regulator ligand-binding domain-containing protein [Anaerolineae bacterium]
MLSLRETLKMPVFAPARLVAGHEGLDNLIRWVHIVDIPDTTYEWRRYGVLLLTAGFGLRGDPERQAALVPKLVEQGFAGMVLCVGYYFDKTPQVICEDADRLGFPIIETPPDLLFIEITEAVLERIVNEQYAILQQSNRIYQQLTDLVLQGANLTDLAGTLAGLLQRSVTIEDPAFYILATAQQGPVDDAREQSVEHGRTPPQLSQRLFEAGIYDQLLEKMGPVRVAPMPELDMTMERVVAPIIVDREIHGYIWVIAGDHPLTDLDEMAISHGATVAALILFKEQAVRQAEEALRGDFFEALLRGESESAAFWEQAHTLNFHRERPCQILIVHGSLTVGGSNYPLQDYVSNWLRSHDLTALLSWRDGNLVVVLESSDDTAGQQTAQAIIQDLRHPAQSLLIGVGNRYSLEANKAGSIRLSYEEAREALRIGLAFGQTEGFISFAELGLLHWLYHLPPEKRAGNIYLERIQALAAYDERRKTNLIHTLEVYLEQGGSLVEAAQALFIHRNTLLHRLERIEKLCEVSLRDPLQRLNMYTAVKSHRLHNKNN